MTSFSRAKGLSYSPIVDVHIWYDRPVMEEIFSGFVDSPLQWVFNKTRMRGDKGDSGQYLCISLSGAWQYADMPKQEIREMFLDEMKSVFPRARDAQVERLLIVKQPRATFRSVPGVEAHRLPSATPISNLLPGRGVGGYGLAGYYGGGGTQRSDGCPGAVHKGAVRVKALVLAPLAPVGLEELRTSLSVVYESWTDIRSFYAPDELAQRLNDEQASVLVIEADFVFEEVFQEAPDLRFVGVCRAAVNHVDVEAATEHGVVVVNTPARTAQGVAELTLGLMISLARRITQAHRYVGGWRLAGPDRPLYLHAWPGVGREGAGYRWLGRYR